MRVLISPQAFKGSLSAFEVASAMKDGIHSAIPTAKIDIIPIADGGDGTLDVLINSRLGTFETTTATDPLGRKIKVSWGILPDGKTCVIELAQVSGISRLLPDERNPLNTSSFGFGQVILEALDRGYRQFILAIGGSATSDLGVGMASALGIKFFDRKRNSITPTGGFLTSIEKIDISQLDPRIKESRVLVACDVTNRLLGKNGATRIFAKQKGATLAMIEILENNLLHLATVIKRDVEKDIFDLVGGGAAGGVGAGLYAFLGAHLRNGIDVVMEYLDYEESLKSADIVVVGEGRIDKQTLFNKAPFGIAKKAKLRGLPVIAIVGSCEEGIEKKMLEVIDAIIPLSYGESISFDRTRESISLASKQAFRCIQIGKQFSKL